MKKLIYSIFSFMLLAIVVAACSGDSYQKRIDKEKKAIKNFLADSGIEVLRTYPANHKFEKNQYYLEGSSGVYLQVINPGNLDDTLAKEERMEVFLRYDSVLQMVTNKYQYGNNNQGGSAIRFNYGVSSTYLGNVSSDEDVYLIMSPSCVLPLDKGIGNGAEVSLIVPFRNGSSYQMSYYEPFFFPYIKYTHRRQSTDKAVTEE